MSMLNRICIATGVCVLLRFLKVEVIFLMKYITFERFFDRFPIDSYNSYFKISLYFLTKIVL